MTLVTDIRRTVTESTPVYVAVGVTDLAVEKVRDARERAAAARANFSVTDLPARVAGQAQQVPTQAFNRTLEIAGRAQESYDDLAERGEKLVKRLRTQKATKDLIAQAETTVRLGRGAVTTARKAATETQRAARATLTAGRHEAAAAVETVAESVQDEAATSAEAVRKSASRTRSTAKRASTPARKRTASTQRATKATASSARKTAATAAKATKTAAGKVGD
jgi:heparin binding hemagglutinin HbhA